MNITINKKYQILFKKNKDILFYHLVGGRGSSKSFTTSLALANKLISEKGNILICRQYMSNVQASVIPEFLDKIQSLNINHMLKVNKNDITCITNGNILYFKGLETAEHTAEASLKGIKSLSTVLIDEFQECKEEAFDRLVGTVRDKDLNLSIITCTNPTNKKTWQYQRLFKHVPDKFTGQIGSSYYIYSSYLDSLSYLNDLYIKEIENLKNTNYIKYANQYLGVWLDSSDNVLFTKESLDDILYTKPIECEEIVIAVDPAVSTGKDSDSTGIIVAGRLDDVFYILEDASGKYTPNQWGNKVNELNQKYKANYIVAEKNQGGDLVEQNIRTCLSEELNIELVHASKGKRLRAEPITVLYEQKRVKHTRTFPELLEQMMTFTGSTKDKSPDRLDALVYALTYLKDNECNYSSGF